MGLFGGKKDGPTDDERYTVLSLAKDEDHTLHELVTRTKIEGLDRVRLTINELVAKRMVEVVVLKPNRERMVLEPAQAANLLNKRSSWQSVEPGQDKLLLVATDKGWRWHEKHWKPHD